MNQTEAIHELLKQGPITPMMALRECNCFRLAARIYDLKGQGVNIVKHNITRNGKTYAQYRIEKSGTG